MNPNPKQFLCVARTIKVTALAAALVVAQETLAQTIPNASFEADNFTVSPGYISGNTAITGWTGTPADRVGLNPASGSPFADNGAIPDGSKVAFIQSNVSDPATPSTLTTTISGLTPGTAYRVIFRANARTATTPNVKVYVDGLAVLLPGGPDGFSTADVGGSNPYWYVACEFTAAAASATLAVVNDATGDQTLLVDDFKIAPSTGRWSISPWNGDIDSGVDSTYLYTHAYNFGSSASPVINEITFTGIPGTGPAVAGRFSTTYLTAGPVHDSSIMVFDNSAIMASDFVYGGNVPAGLFQSITLQGLTPGTEYLITVYSVAWEDPNVGSRWAIFNVGDDYRTINQDQYSNDYGIRVSYRYVADATGTITLKFAPYNPVNVSFHVYGFSNREAQSRFVAPIITAQPKSVIVSPDLSVQFSVAASGVPLPAYQWRFNGGAIANATDTAYTLPSATLADVGNYDVVVSNRAGMVTSVVAHLTVGLPMANSSFELDSFFTWPGYISGNTPITGWTWTSAGGAGINPVQGSTTPNPFADNGQVPHGNQVAFLQGDGTLSQTVSGLTVGAQYYIHYFENGRTTVTIPGLELKAGGITVVPAHSVTPVRGGNSYYEISSEVFVPGAADLELAFIKSSPQGDDCTALVDNVAVIPVPAGTPPSVGTQPQPLTVYVGEPASFSAVAQGSLPLHYQWRLNGNPIADATTTTLTLPSVRLPDEGDYTVVVTNSFGSVTSTVARLSLLESIPTLRNTGIDDAGATLPAAAVDPFWTLLVNPDGGSTNVYVGNDGWPIQAGTWMVNSATSKWVGSRAEVGNAAIPSGTYLYRTTFDLTGRDTNTVTITGRWATDDSGTAVYLNGTTISVPLAGGFGAWTTFTISTATASFLGGTNTLDFGVNNGNAGPTGLRVEFTRTSARTLPGIPAGIGIPPQGGTFTEGDTVVLAVTATGTLPLSYQWAKDGVNLSGKTDATLTLVGVTTNDSGAYRVAVSNPWGSAMSPNAVVSVAYRAIPGAFGTGIATDGTLLPGAAVDPHWILASSVDPLYPGPGAIVVSDGYPIAAGAWVLNGPKSKWIAPRENQNDTPGVGGGNDGGDYVYQTVVDLTGYDVSKVRLVGAWATDNSGTDIKVNGVSTGLTCGGFQGLTPFVITTGLIAGPNTLDFTVYNATNTAVTPNPTGLRVDLQALLSITVPAPRLQITRSGASVVISWSPAAAGQKFQSAPAVSGPWSDISNATNPYTNSITGTLFFRVFTP
ncbi:MAG TPA: immunoglobulin domain-containing protein [Verrucomicrobiae bacterium]